MDALVADSKVKSIRDLVIEYIDHILDRKKWTGTDLARKAGMSPSTILRLLNDPKHEFVPTLKTLNKIAEASGYPIPRRVLDAVNIRVSDLGADDESRSRRRQTVSTVELKHFSSLPTALQSAQAKEVGMRVPCPPQLESDQTAFAFYMFDDSWAPIMRSGVLLFATKRRDPATNDTILLVDKSGKAKLRLVKQIDEMGVGVSKFSAESDETIPFDDIGDIAIVAGCIRQV